MARIRTIKPSFFTSEDICRVPPLARLLFQGLWIEADRDGYLADSPFQLKTRLLPADECDVDALLWLLVAAKLIRRYTAANGRHYIQILTFIEHQRPHPKEPKSAIPHDGTDRQPPTAVERNGEPGQVTGCFPSSPVGREGDLESGDLECGDRGTGTQTTHTPPQPVQGPGAFEAGSLPRDHRNHALCGKGYRLCLSYPVFGKFIARYGGTKDEARSALQAFVDRLEAEHQSIGNYLWLDDHFTALLRAAGRLTDAPGAERGRSAAPSSARPASLRLIDEMEARRNVS